jgi:hypothetical protein
MWLDSNGQPKYMAAKRFFSVKWQKKSPHEDGDKLSILGGWPSTGNSLCSFKLALVEGEQSERLDLF